jgi:alpha-beta hydrolase superfamily lysophospholipase
MKFLTTVLITINFIGHSIGQENYVSQDIKVNSLVYGTLFQPKAGSNSLVIIIAGSGPTDRDGNQQMMQNNSLKMLGQDLAKEGIATFRYDKRIFTLLKQQALQEDKLRFDDFVEDAVSTINYFKTKNKYDAIYVLGHSQGALVGLLAAQQTEVTGYISLAGAGQGIDQTIVNQIGLQMPGLKDDAAQALATLKEKGSVKDFSPALTSILRKSVQPFMASWMQYDPAVEIQKLTIPVLIINGTRDLQVDMNEAEALKGAAPNAQLSVIENMNHVLKEVSDDQMENAKSYNEPSRPLAPMLVETIKNFISTK